MYTKTIEVDFETYIDTLKEPWRTMDQDMQLAYEIILQTHDADEKVCLLDITHAGDDEYHMHFPKWQELVESSLVQQYGDEQGRLIFQKVVMRLFQQTRNTAPALH
jgi:hypothetical protein